MQCSVMYTTDEFTFTKRSRHSQHRRYLMQRRCISNKFKFIDLALYVAQINGILYDDLET